MGLPDILSWLGQFGPWVSLAVVTLAFFLWKDWRRELRLQDRVEKLEKDQQETVLPLVAKCTEVIAQNTAVMGRLEQIMDRLATVQLLNERTTLNHLVADAVAYRSESNG